MAVRVLAAVAALVLTAALATSRAVAAEPPTYAAYAFAYFTGEGFADGEQVYFALSQGNDPLHWTELNGGRPVITSVLGERGVRDPFLIRSPDGSKFFLIATDLKIYGNGDWDRAQRFGSRRIMVWESTDLVNWSRQRSVEVTPPEAGNTWEPEAFWDPASHRYVVFWASALYDNPEHSGSSYQRILYATTRDFRTFTPPRTYLDPGYAVIDTTMIEHAGRVFRFTKDERANTPATPNGKFVFQDVGDSVFDPSFRLITEGIGKGTIARGEGPTVFKSNTEDKWYLFIDEFGGRGYVPFETTDLDSGVWTLSADYELPARPRHGTVLPVTQLESDRLAATPPRVCTRTLTGRVRGTLNVASGVTCLDDADVHGRVAVSGGASLVVNGGSVHGSLAGSGAGVISVRDAELRGSVTFDATSQWLRIAASRVAGRVSVNRSAGPVAADLTDTWIKGALACTGNATPLVLTGTKVSGRRSGQCAAS
jgi:hypothetical protein